MLKTSEERREAEEERKRIQANIEQHKLLEAEQQAQMKRVRCGVLMRQCFTVCTYRLE